MKITKEEYKAKLAARDLAQAEYDAAKSALKAASQKLNDAHIAVPSAIYVEDVLRSWANTTESDTLVLDEAK